MQSKKWYAVVAAVTWIMSAPGGANADNAIRPVDLNQRAVASGGAALAPMNQPAQRRADTSGAAQSPDQVKAAIESAPRPAAPRGGPDCSGDAANLIYPLDGSYTLVDFFGDGPTGSGPAGGPDQANDDDSATVPLPFTFDFYGASETSCFVNNNGNLSFGSPFSAFTATGFPVADFPMVAAFWGDVDTRGAFGQVWQKFVDGDGDTADDTLVVTWDNVGYFAVHGDLRNTFQVAISNGLNPTMGLGNNICFSYDNMCWTTGDASGGSGGFGGVAATVGANRGNGIDFFQIGRYDHAGSDYDGPFDNNDGIDSLDGRRFCFNASGANIPPIPVDFPPGNQVSLDTSAGDVLNLTVRFLSPEGDQTTSVAISDPDGAQAAGLTITNTPGNAAVITMDWTPDCADEDTYVLEFTATDSYDPPGVTTTRLLIEVVCPNQPPSCDAGGPYNVECGGATTTVSLDGSASSDPDGDELTYSWTTDCPGATITDGDTATPTLVLESSPGCEIECNVTLTVSDGTESASCDATITVTDTTAPSVSVDEMHILWTPNHKYRTLDLADCIEAIEDTCGGSLTVDGSASITSIYSDEPEDARGNGDGNTLNDIVILGPTSFMLRVERNGGTGPAGSIGAGNGRVYGVNFQVVDDCGNTADATCLFGVPHSQNGAPPVDDGPSAGYTVTP